jgi:ATPase subunit of ABC transporter with duplicated ATPase domains
MLLTLANLSKAYGDNQVLANVTLTMHAGDKWGLVGANGVGKSTLLKIIVGEVEADAGACDAGKRRRDGLPAAGAGCGAALTVDELLAQSQARVHAIERGCAPWKLEMAQPQNPALAGGAAGRVRATQRRVRPAGRL